MLISYHWLCGLLGADPGVDRVAARLTAGGLEVEHTEHVGRHLRDVVFARVISSRPHPASKAPLTLVTVDAGDGTALEVVCGAPNVPAPGHLVALARVGATVLGKGGVPVTLEARPVAGIVSAGMLCAEDELGLGTNHGGILVFPPGDSVGTPLADLPGMVDSLLTLNVTPNRGDALSHRGVARDVAALLGLSLPETTGPSPFRDVSAAPSGVTVSLVPSARCPRYAAAVIKGITVGPSPLRDRVRLHRLGVRPINNVVDVTNLVMLEYGQPLHAFDRARLQGGVITVRRATAGETMVSLDGITRTLREDDTVIADGQGPVAIAGVMGGDRSGVADTTRDVVIECAAFEPGAVRRTARRLGLHTESSHRFERGTDVTAVGDVLRAAAQAMVHSAGGQAAGGPVDLYPAPVPRRVITLRPSRITAVLGVAIDRQEALTSLTALGCEVREHGADELAVGVPGHRNDVTREIDLVEEVGRVWGFDRIPGILPPTRTARAGARRDWHARRTLRSTACALGLDEAVSYVFVSPREVSVLGMDPAEAVKLVNPLSEERSLLRPSLLPKLVAALGRARRHGESRVRLFELGSVFARGAQGEALPGERTRIGMVMAGPRDAWLTRTEDVGFYDLKGVVEELVRQRTGTEAVFQRDVAPPPWLHPGAYAHVMVDGHHAGTLGVLHPDVVERADLGRPAVVAELWVDAVEQVVQTPEAKAPPRFPSVRRDVALQVGIGVPAGEITARLKTLAGPLCESVTLFDRYVGAELPAGTHSLAFALTFRAEDRTLQDADVDPLAQGAVHGAQDAFGAAQR